MQEDISRESYTRVLKKEFLWRKSEILISRNFSERRCSVSVSAKEMGVCERRQYRCVYIEGVTIMNFIIIFINVINSYCYYHRG